MAVLAAADLPKVQAQHARVDRLIRAGLVDLSPVIKDCTRDMYAEAKRLIASENDGKNEKRHPNTLLAGKPPLGGVSGGIAKGTRVVGLRTRTRPSQYDILCFSTQIGEWMQEGTKAHTITATNPSGRLAFPVVASGQSGVPLKNSAHFTHAAERAGKPALAQRRRTVASRLLGSVAVSWRTPQSVHHPGTPPRPFLVYSGPFFDAHLWTRAVRYIALAAEGTLGDVL